MRQRARAGAKRRYQRKYESIFVEDLLNDMTAVRRGQPDEPINRRHRVRTLEVPLSMPDDKTGGGMDVAVYVEVEEERSEPWSHQPR